MIEPERSEAARGTLGIVGAGPFGAALASVVGEAGTDVLLWSTSADLVDAINRERALGARLPGLRVPDRVRATRDPAELAAGARLIVIAVSSADVRDRARALARVLDGGHFLVHAIGASTGPDDTRVSALLTGETPVKRVGALAGPALPADLIARRFAAMVCASAYDEVSREARRLLNLPPALRVYVSRDLVGVELSAALSGAYTVALGMADALALGAGPRAVLLTRIVAEGQRLVAALGGDGRSFTGLAGLGNLLVRAAPGGAEHAPGYQYGRSLGSGSAPTRDRVPDAVRAAAAGARLALRAGQHAPVLEAISRVVEGTLSPKEAAAALADTVAMEE